MKDWLKNDSTSRSFNYLDLGDEDDGGQPGGDGLPLLRPLSLYVTQASFPLVLRAPLPPPALIRPGLSGSRAEGRPCPDQTSFSTLSYCQFCFVRVFIECICPHLFVVRLRSFHIIKFKNFVPYLVRFYL